MVAGHTPDEPELQPGLAAVLALVTGLRGLQPDIAVLLADVAQLQPDVAELLADVAELFADVAELQPHQPDLQPRRVRPARPEREA